MKLAGALTHKGYVGGDLALDADTGFIDGRIVNARSVITFAGRDHAELEAAFVASVEDYLAVCAEEGIAPERPFSGQINVRLGVDLHRALVLSAEREGVSLNTFVTRVLERSATDGAA